MLPILAELATHTGARAGGRARWLLWKACLGRAGWRATCGAAFAARSGEAAAPAPRTHLQNPHARPAPRNPPCTLAAAPGYQPAVVTAFYLPYLLLPATLALHMAATPAPFGRAAGGSKGKGKRK